MALRLTLLALTLTALSAGCTAPAAGIDRAAADQSPPEGAEDSGSHGMSSVTSSFELGSAKGSTLTPARYPFKVTVPDGGAKDVRWDLTIETTSDSLLQRVEGPGCGSTGIMVILVGTSTFGGHCDDLAPGEHEFAAVLDSAAVSFTAVVKGQVTVVNEW